MSTGADGQDRRLESALARLVAEAAPRPALHARVRADAAMVAAERWPVPGQRQRALPRRGLLARLFERPAFGLAGAAATVAIGVALGFGLVGGDDVSPGGSLDTDLLSALSPLDGIEREVMASLDEDLLDPDAPL